MTNHDLAKQAAESCCASIFIGIGLTDFDTPGKQKTVEDTIARKVSDTYAPAMDELGEIREQLEATEASHEDEEAAHAETLEMLNKANAELERLRRQVEFVKLVTPVTRDWWCICGYLGEDGQLQHAEDCPHAKEAV